MPLFNTRSKPYTPPRPISFQWDNFKGGLNTLLRPTELKENELSQADNLWLVGEGIPTKRPGTADYFMGNATGSVEMVKGVYFKDGTNELLSITGGIATKKSNASYSVIGGASFASGYSAHGVMVQNSLYMVNGQDKITKYSGASLIRFNALSTPTNVLATLISGASAGQQKTYSYRVTALSPIGETLGSIRASVVSGPQDLTTTLLRLNWNAVSAASGDLIGYNIYGRDPGNETYLGNVAADTLKFDDNGLVTPSLLTEPPTANTTDGPIAKYIIKHIDKLVVAGINSEPSRVQFSGGGANVDRFHWSYGGGYVDISKDDGDIITGLYSFQDKVIVFKEKSIWQITFSTVNISDTQSIVFPNVKNITNSHGAVSHRTIQAVENDIFFLSRNGVYVLGNEPNIIGDILRTNELSAKIRPTIATFNFAQITKCAAIYWNYKYILTYPGSGQSVNTAMLIYDRERTSWMGPWNIGANGFEIYYDSTNTEQLLYGDTSDNFITEVDETFRDDKATTISTFLRTKKEDFKDWSLFKTLHDVFFNFRNVLGEVSVNIRLEGKTGETTTAESFTVSSSQGSSGWGTDQWGSVEWGLTLNSPGQTLNEIIKQARLIKTARAMQIEVQTSNRNDQYELIGIRGDARIKSGGARPSSWRIAMLPPVSVLNDSVVSSMTGAAHSSEVIFMSIQRIIVEMMNNQIFILATFLAAFITFSYFLAKSLRKSGLVTSKTNARTVFVSGVKGANSLLSKFLFGFKGHNLAFSGGIATASSGAILTSPIFYPVRSSQKFLTTIKTPGKKTVDSIVQPVTVFGVATEGAKSLTRILRSVFVGTKLAIFNHSKILNKKLLGVKPATERDIL